MATWAYQFQLDPRSPVESGELTAKTEDEARRKLRVLLAAPRLPSGTKLVNLTAEAEAAAVARSGKLRALLRISAAHHAWLNGDATGERADLSRANLAGLNLHDANLSNAEMTEADLSDADLRDTDLRGADLTGADLWRANLIGTCITPEALHKALQCRKK